MLRSKSPSSEQLLELKQSDLFLLQAMDTKTDAKIQEPILEVIKEQRNFMLRSKSPSSEQLLELKQNDLFLLQAMDTKTDAKIQESILEVIKEQGVTTIIKDYCIESPTILPPASCDIKQETSSRICSFPQKPNDDENMHPNIEKTQGREDIQSTSIFSTTNCQA